MQELKPIKVEYKYLDREKKKRFTELTHKYNCIRNDPMEAVMNLNSIQINPQLGQEILVGKKQEKARITKIEHFEKSGDIVINTQEVPEGAYI